MAEKKEKSDSSSDMRKEDVKEVFTRVLKKLKTR